MYLIDPNNPTGYSRVLEETTQDYNTGGTSLKTYTLGLDVIAQADDSVFGDGVDEGSGAAGSVKFLMYDSHGSTRYLTNDTGGEEAEYYDYEAYGNLRGGNPGVVVGPTATNLLFGGEMFDPATQQYNLRARYYDPMNGRFNRMDPYAGSMSNPLTLNKYGYVHGDPVNGIDPSGMITLVGSLKAISISTIVMGFSSYAVTGGNTKAGLYGAYAGFTTSSSVVMILANPFNKVNPTQQSDDFMALAWSTGAGALIGMADYMAEVFHGMASGKRNSNIQISELYIAMLKGIAKANEGFMASYGIISMLPHFSAKANYLIKNFGPKEQKAAGAMLGVTVRSITDGSLYRNPGSTAGSILRSGFYAYMAGALVDAAWTDSVEGYMTSMAAKRVEKAFIEVISFF